MEKPIERMFDNWADKEWLFYSERLVEATQQWMDLPRTGHIIAVEIIAIEANYSE